MTVRGPLFKERGPLRLAFDALLDLIYPLRCVLCGGTLDGLAPDKLPSREIGICPDCRRLLVTDKSLLCPDCGEIGDIPADGSRCADCRNHRAAFERIVSLGPYTGYLRSRILLMKTEKSGYTAEAMARLIWAARSQALRQSNCDLCVPVPRHYLRRLRRGVNDASFLAWELGRMLAIPFDDRLLRRVRATPPQSRLGRAARLANVAGAFAVAPKRAKRLAGRRVLLVDDILTTGATAGECIRVLKEAGAAGCVVAVCARAGRNQYFGP
ncbi:MAG: ComF family protein [Thermoguttaceae bacterium]|nr:ComF family protein [Thermoguttaceae bacterium]